ncbi:hypothetical protein J6O48_02930 [bacterium]|nr:hypothetical protein [bacterium]
MALFNVPKRPGREQDKAIAGKSKSRTRATTTVKGGGLLGQINQIKAMVEKYLGKFKDDYEILTTEEDLDVYFQQCTLNGVISIDTETTGLDPILDSIVGLCIYTPNNKAAYVPINHVSYVTGVRVDNQLTEKQVADRLEALIQCNPVIVMFNAKFDMRVIRNQLGVKDIYCTWDCYLAGRLLNENEELKGLKALHQKYVLDGKEDEFKFDALFKGITADKIPINTFYLYAAHDAIITYELYQYQKQYIYYEADKPNEDRNGMNGVSWVFFNIEMPCIKVVCDMEDNGVKFDFEYQQKLSEKYNKLLEEAKNTFYKMCDGFVNEDIWAYKRQNPNHKLDDPINIGSPTQVAILLYDILKIEPPDPKSPRGTGEAILQKIDNPIAKAILDYREMSKLVSTYIDKLPNCVNPKDGRIHCSFNQYGADTGRFSSSDPNLQNIPSHNKDIRKMFVASDGYVLMSSDYSQQEPKVMTQMCGDPKMIKAYQEGKDLYAEIAALSFNTTYDNCLEFRPDGTTNPEGKARRSQAKSILLGVLYGRGVPSIAEQLGTTTKKAQAIKDSVFKGFPAIPKFEQDSLEMAYEKGYVTTLWGRKRRLPDLQLPEYEFKWKDGARPDADLLDFSEEEFEGEVYVPDELQQKYIRRLRQAYFGQKRKIFEEANKEGIWIVDNGAKIADAQRQCVNARIQGSAADMSKLAMILVGNDERLKELGFRLLIPVHDELIAECPEENVKECSERFAQLMSEAARSRLTIPIKCDVEITKAWYGDTITGEKLKERESKTSHAMDAELMYGNK